LTYPVSNRRSRTGPSPCATAAPSAAPGGRQHCHAAQDAARAPAPTRLEVRNSLVRVHPYRSQRRRPGPNTAARAVSPLQIGSPPSGGQPEGRMAVRAWAGHPSRTGVEVSAPTVTAHSFPGNIFGAPGSGARRGLRRNTVATSPGLTKRPEWKNRWSRCAACQSVLWGRSTRFPSRCCADGPIVAAADPAAWPLGSGEVAAEAPGCYAGSPVEVAGADRAAPVASRRRRRRGSACRTATDRMRQWPQRRPGRIAAEVVADARM
jgi:hypothetical protein